LDTKQIRIDNTETDHAGCEGGDPCQTLTYAITDSRGFNLEFIILKPGDHPILPIEIIDRHYTFLKGYTTGLSAIISPWYHIYKDIFLIGRFGVLEFNQLEIVPISDLEFLIFAEKSLFKVVENGILIIKDCIISCEKSRAALFDTMYPNSLSPTKYYPRAIFMGSVIYAT
jgi:hypothetical protein